MYLEIRFTYSLYSGYFLEEMPSCKLLLPKKIKTNSNGPTILQEKKP